MPDDNSITRLMYFDRETKRYFRFSEAPDENGRTVVGNIYLKKEEVREIGDGQLPETIAVTVSCIEDLPY